MPLPLRFAGRLHDDLSLALAYAAADVVVVPSRLDNLPQSATEALACGTPVVAFRQGGLEDVVEHRVSGWLAQPFNPHHLALGIAWCLNTPGLAPSPARLSGWRPAAVAEAHTALYGSVLEP
jgi:glycosyltransferase involved in cell wall biosynthesis